MIKKKCERQAKEKEEKSKKANELAALKRKTEITKTFAHRSRIPLPNNVAHNSVNISLFCRYNYHFLLKLT